MKFAKECQRVYDYYGNKHYLDITERDQQHLAAAYIEDNYDASNRFEIISDTTDSDFIPPLIIEYFKGGITPEFLGKKLAMATLHYVEQWVAREYEDFCDNKERIRISSPPYDTLEEAGYSAEDISNRMSDYNVQVFNNIFGGK